MSTNLGLVLHHNLFLTRDQRYALHAGQDVETVGTTVSVWCRGSVTTEPAKEIFCRYLIRNLGQDLPIKMVNDGFEIALPNRQPLTSQISNDLWRQLSEKEWDEFYQMFRDGASTSNLLNVEDGGSACLMYREHNKIRYMDDVSLLTIIHLIQIRDYQILEDSCNFNPNWYKENPKDSNSTEK
jgi:hypothetical protein